MHQRSKKTRLRMASSISLSKNPKGLILETMERTNGVIVHAAHELGVTRETLRLWIVKLDLYPQVRQIRAAAKASTPRIPTPPAPYSV